jgi:hypothetical protein
MPGVEITDWQTNVRAPSRLPAVQRRLRSSLQATKTLSPSAATDRSHAPWPVGLEAITGGEKERPPLRLVAIATWSSRVR